MAWSLGWAQLVPAVGVGWCRGGGGVDVLLRDFNLCEFRGIGSLSLRREVNAYVFWDRAQI